jgi:hypothetical protein
MRAAVDRLGEIIGSKGQEAEAAMAVDSPSKVVEPAA